MASFCLAYLFGKWYYFYQNSWIWGFFTKTSSDDGVGHPWQGPFFFFKKSTSSFPKNTHIAVFVFFLPMLPLPMTRFQIWLAGWLADGWPITYLATPIHFGGILCILYIIQCILYKKYPKTATYVFFLKGDVFFLGTKKKRPLPGMPRLSSELVFTKNPKFKEF